MGMLELRGALVDPPFQPVVHLLQAQFALAQILRAAPGFMLAATALDGGAGDAQQRRRMERSFDERHVAQCIEPTPGDGIALSARRRDLVTSTNGRSGPGGLAAPATSDSGLRSALWICLLGHQDEGDVVVEGLDEFRKIAAWRAANCRPRSINRFGDRGIAPARRENQRAKLAFREKSLVTRPPPDGRRRDRRGSCGTPATRRESSTSGSPIRKPLSIQNSRIVSSCAPVRFLMTMEGRGGSEPAASK